EQERDRGARPGVEDDDHPVVRGRRRPGEAAGHLHGVRPCAVDVSRLDVDLALRLGEEEVDHLRHLGLARRGCDERRLDDVDARGHRQRRTNVPLAQDPHRRHRGGSLPRWRPRGQHPRLSEYPLTRYGRHMARIRPFEMERYQSLYWHLVDHDLSESGVVPLTLRELLGPEAEAETFLQQALGYPLSEGSYEARANIAQWDPDCGPDKVTLTNGGSEANFLSVWSLLDRGDRLAFMLPNYCQGLGLGSFFGAGVDTFKLRLRDGRWALDLEGLERAVGRRTKAIMLCNPDNPTGAVLAEGEMEAGIEAPA